MIIAPRHRGSRRKSRSRQRSAQNPAYRLTRYYLFYFHCTVPLVSGGCAKTVQSPLSFSIPSVLSMIRRVRSRSSFTYGAYGSNFRPFVNRRDVKGGRDADLTQEPEMVRAFRDAWELGIHAYLTYLRDRLLLARDLLNESGSCFVQSSDENLDRVKALMHETFGAHNFCSIKNFRNTSGASSPFAKTNVVGTDADYVLWYAFRIRNDCFLSAR
jgi:hypothetical protein